MLSPFLYLGSPTRCLKIGKLSLGGDAPIRIQSMTTTDTMDTQATVEQSIALFDAGAELVRITAPGPKDAENLAQIKSDLVQRGYEQPLVADIHFSPKAAMIALEHVEKVRINPGNFVDRKRFQIREYTDQEYQEELEALKESFVPLVRRAKDLGRVLRIGSNHGSLSDRILNRYGDTPLGMIESALEFIRFAREEDYHDIVVSMKSSNPRVMVEAYRLLSLYFHEHSYDYPLHLGVTEAGGQRDGRMKSALGIGSLLIDGIGDTIRVSLTEDPVQEIYAAKDILKSLEQKGAKRRIQSHSLKEREYWEKAWLRSLSSYKSMSPEYKKSSLSLKQKNGKNHKVKENKVEKTAKAHLESSALSIFQSQRKLHPVFVKLEQFTDKKKASLQKEKFDAALLQKEWQKKLEILQRKGCDALWCSSSPHSFSFSSLEGKTLIQALATLNFPWVQDIGKIEIEKKDLSLSKLSVHRQAAAVNLDIDGEDLQEASLPLKKLQNELQERKQSLFLHCISEPQNLQACIEALFKTELLKNPNLVLSLSIKNTQGDISPCEIIFAYRLLYSYKEKRRAEGGSTFPPVLLRASYASSENIFLVDSSIYLGSLLLDGLGDALFIDIKRFESEAKLQFQLDLLQATRLRFSKTEYISCPSCGRTLFDLEETTARIRKRTGHLKGLKIAVMGCIVNGPGEMADADFGYVGAGPGKVHLYHKKELVKANIPTAEADEELVRLIQKNHAWSELPLSSVENKPSQEKPSEELAKVID